MASEEISPQTFQSVLDVDKQQNGLYASVCDMEADFPGCSQKISLSNFPKCSCYADKQQNWLVRKSVRHLFIKAEDKRAHVGTAPSF